MQFRLHKLTPHRHLLLVQRDDGTTTRDELDSRSFVRHDLMHWCFENRAGITDAFLGQGAAPTTTSQAYAVTEVLVGMLQGVAGREVDPQQFVDRAAEYLPSQGHVLPPFVDAAFVRAVLAHWQRLYGQWQSLRVGGILELR
ncbi:MAG: hypothetical protein IPK26_03780 [Planctomycetes bacterium]|nr:hypothetical protein [Planctomycetota bacterium]